MDNKIAIYGGTFDPIHLGHMALAEAAVRECRLDKLVFMPDYISPFKQGRETASGSDRYEMIKSILHYNPAFCISSYEISKENPSYTIDTLEFWDEAVSAELSFVLGLDSVLEIDTWMRGAEILSKYPLITGIRPGPYADSGLSKIDALRAKYGANITILDMQPIDISSSDIRRRIKSGLDISDLIAPEVEEYIIEHKLYE